MKKLLRFKSKGLLDFKNLGFIFFYIGTFLLPSALFLAAIFILISCFIGSFYNSKNFFKDKWNIPLIISGILMITSAIMHNYILKSPVENLWDKNLSYIGLFNWIPFFWLFWSSQIYLFSKSDRKIFCFLLIAGSLPVLISGFAQYYFNIHGPFQTLYGLIIWYQREVENPSGLTSLFNNANYAGSWLSIVLPLSIASFLDITKSHIKKGISLLFLLSIGWSILLTNSRSAWGSLLASLPAVIGINSFRWLLPIITILALFLAITVLPIFSSSFQEYLREIIPNKLWMEFSQLGFESMDVSRVGIWSDTLQNILKNPLFGYGGSSFPILYEFQSGFWKGHPHNFLLEIGFSYGLPAAMIIFIFIIFLIFLSFKKIFLIKNFNLAQEKDFYTKAFWASIFILFITQQIDLHYFDGRISIAFWLLLAGLKNIVNEKPLKSE
tara:strand:+ start:1822 stop:3138 length:1317 start_codon:yes stop_codon:yes gene_type:complete